MNFKILAMTAALVAGTFFGARAQAAVSSQTEDFVRNASVGNMFEVESSKLALTKTSSRDVKNFAQMMVTDHTHIGEQMKQALSTSGTGLKPADLLDSEHQKMLDDLKSASATTFDRSYVQDQSRAHDSAVTMFMDYADNGDNTMLQKFASNTLPMLQKHQDMLRTLSQTYISSLH